MNRAETYTEMLLFKYYWDVLEYIVINLFKLIFLDTDRLKLYGLLIRDFFQRAWLLKFVGTS